MAKLNKHFSKVERSELRSQNKVYGTTMYPQIVFGWNAFSSLSKDVYRKDETFLNLFMKPLTQSLSLLVALNHNEFHYSEY